MLPPGRLARRGRAGSLFFESFVRSLTSSFYVLVRKNNSDDDGAWELRPLESQRHETKECSLSIINRSFHAKTKSLELEFIRAMRSLEEDDDYTFPNPFLTCSWSWDEDNTQAGITQDCFYVVPEDNDNQDPFDNAEWIESRCVWSSIYTSSPTIDCNITGPLRMNLI